MVEGKRPEDGGEHGQVPGKTLTEKYSGHTKDVRRTFHESIVDTKMEPGQ